MSREHTISFSVSVREKAQIESYVRRKKRWRTPADLARDAVWQFIARNPAGSHRRPEKGPKKAGDTGIPKRKKDRGAVLHPPLQGKSKAGL